MVSQCNNALFWAGDASPSCTPAAPRVLAG